MSRRKHGTSIISVNGAIALLVVAVLIPVRSLTAEGSCPGDVDRDGTVAVTDLLDVLASWGPYAPCPPLTPEDLNGDCTIDIQDLLELLAAWGPCPAPATGACCLSDGGCLETTAADCRSSSGTFLGEDTQCPPGACGAGVVGACCLANGTCVEVDIPACAALGGSYQGVGVACAPGLCE